MSDKILAIRWHGRGGQGAKTAALLFGEAALATGKHVQAFPEYGPERMGAPVLAFNRISDHPITLHCAITEPDIVVILDPTLIDAVPVSEGLKPGGRVIVNTTFPPQEIAGRLGLPPEQVFTVDASRIALDTIGLAIPNTPMLGALVKVMGSLDLEDLLEDTRGKLEQKFRHKPQVIEGNLESIRRAYQEARNGTGGGGGVSNAAPLGARAPSSGAGRKESWRELPAGLVLEAGTARGFRTGDWRTERPVWDAGKCSQCLICWISCPDSSIRVQDGKVLGIDYDHCKGCGICARECPPKARAITMELERK